MYYAQEGKLSDNLLYGSTKSSENASKRRKRREDISKKRLAAYKLTTDPTNHRRSGRNHNVMESDSLHSFKIISKPKQPASFAFIAPKAAARAQTVSPADSSNTKNSRYGLPRGVGTLNLGAVDHGRFTRPQTAGSSTLRKRFHGTDSYNANNTLPSGSLTSSRNNNTSAKPTARFMLQQSENAFDISPINHQRGNARQFSTGKQMRSRNQRRRPTRLTRKKERIARRLGIVQRPSSAPISRKNKTSLKDQDNLMFDVRAPIRPGKKLNDYILLKNHANDMTACVGLLEDAIEFISGAERLVTYRNKIIGKTLKHNDEQTTVIDEKVAEREREIERQKKQAEIERIKDRNSAIWRLRSE